VYQPILVRYGEIALKGKNRRYFEDALQQNIKRALAGTGAEVRRRQGRFLVLTPREEGDQVLDLLSRVFGIVSISPVFSAEASLESIQETAAALVESLPPTLNTFKVESRRPNKNFPLTSPEINRLVGAYLLKRFPHLRVDVHQPSFQILIEVHHREAFLYHDSLRGPGGLPLGVTGSTLLLLSGGIDSPVAGWLAMKRGLKLEALHFHSFPFTGHRAREKVVDLCRKLARYGLEIPLHQISLTAIQKEIRARCPEALSITLLRRMMLRLAEALAQRRNLQSITTGESLGQVASQTLESLQVISAVTPMLLFRPLLCMDKHEIVALAQAIETYDISIRPYEDCCTLFVPRHPATRPTFSQVERAEANLDLDSLLQEALDTLGTEVITPELTSSYLG